MSKVLTLLTHLSTLLVVIKCLNSVIKTTSDANIYSVHEGKRHPFSDWDVFISLGYTDLDVNVVTEEEMAAIPLGIPILPQTASGKDPVVKVAGEAYLFIISGGQRRTVPDYRTFISMGYDDKDILTISSIDALYSLPLGPPLPHLTTATVDPPEYTRQQELLLAASSSQKFIKDMWKYGQIGFNPGMVVLPSSARAPNNTALLLWAPGYSCKNCGTKFMFVKVGGKRGDWSVMGEVGDVMRHGAGAGGKDLPAIISDPRLFVLDDAVKVIFCGNDPSTGLQISFIGCLSVDFTAHKVVLISSEMLTIHHEMGHMSQKNWSPFVYKMPLSGAHDGAAQEVAFFIYSSTPHHRIIHANETSTTCATPAIPPAVLKENEGEEEVVQTTPVHTVCVTEMTTPLRWRYGPPHGGSGAELVDTPHGPRYLTFFHSSGMIMDSWCASYFMGAYLFEAAPPFAITHISEAPLVPRGLYDQLTEGWAFKAIDYIVFPMGFFVLGGDVFLSMGHNDKSGWIVQMELAGLVSSLPAVESSVKANHFNSHFSRQHSDAERRHQ